MKSWRKSNYELRIMPGKALCFQAALAHCVGVVHRRHRTKMLSNARLLKLWQ
ncbi:hypothetical protein [Nostoc sp. CALU 546]|uniref:hypothetical protein n=1 Tax=Nostoc sp. CALU 546 TaxID=1867241 RepID=UPI003B66BB83